eukprot:5878010-Lingulodinium_polyedra.AAC.1
MVQRSPHSAFQRFAQASFQRCNETVQRFNGSTVDLSAVRPGIVNGSPGQQLNGLTVRRGNASTAQ